MVNFILKSGQFVRVSGEGTISKHKCYLQLPASLFAGTRSIGIGYDDDGTTSIEMPEIAPQEEGVYYNLNGQRVDNPGKGLYIRSGKKLVIK